MSNVAFMTIGILKAAADDPQIQGFVDRGEANFKAAENSPGYIDHSDFDETTELHTWEGRSFPPIFQDEAYSDITPQTLSLWQDLESIFAFAYYNSTHSEALRKRKEWFVQPEWPTYVAWWVEDGHTPSWTEAYKHYDKLCKEGSSKEAFDFKQPFDSDGQAIKIDREAVKRMMIPKK